MLREMKVEWLPSLCRCVCTGDKCYLCFTFLDNLYNAILAPVYLVICILKFMYPWNGGYILVLCFVIVITSLLKVNRILSYGVGMKYTWQWPCLHHRVPCRMAPFRKALQEFRRLLYRSLGVVLLSIWMRIQAMTYYQILERSEKWAALIWSLLMEGFNL